MLLASDGAAITGLWFVGQKYFACPPAPRREGPDPLLAQGTAWLDAYFAGKTPPLLPPLNPRGTPFQREVWGLLLEIPYGQTRSYGAIAAELARRRGLPHMSAQAVGGAVGRNPISVLIPCHRAVGKDGSLTGYAGGLARKAALLALEKPATPCQTR